MSISAFDEIYAAPSKTGPLHARPLGNLIASMIGGMAVLVLCASIFFIKPPAPAVGDVSAPSQTATQAAVQASPAISAPPDAAPAKLFAAFDLNAPEFSKEKKSFSVRRRDLGGRDDIMTIGEFSGGGAFMRLTIQQTGGEKLGNSDFFLDMSRHATQAGLAVVRISPPGPLVSRFGAFEAADIRLTPSAAETSGQAPAATNERSCLAVRLMTSKLSLEIVGLACGAGAKAVDRRSMSCILNRLEYLAPGESKALDQLFSKAEADDRVQSCSAAAPSATAAKPAPRPGSAPTKRSPPAR
jgi:hypothetical protein